MKRFIFAALLILICPAYAKADVFIGEIKERKLGLAKEWRALLHYEGGKSKISQPEFFVSPAGASDPEAELLAFFNAAQKSSEIICRFPARLLWLNHVLEGVTDINLPQCGGFNEYLNNTKVKDISVYYVSQSLITPESMFGHLGLRLIRNNEDGVASLGHSFSYTANLGNNDFLPLMIVKGIAGKYKGVYVLKPFSQTVREYNVLENRDIWEFVLTLTPLQKKLITYHLWELKGIYTPYKFFTENCATVLEEVLRAGIPDIKINNGLRSAPLDIVNNIYDGNYAHSMGFYPSDVRKYLSIINSSTPRDKSLIKKLERQKTVTADNFIAQNPDNPAYVMAALQIKNNLNFDKGKISEQEYLNKFDGETQFKNYSSSTLEIEMPYNPLNAHGPTRLDFNYGYSDIFSSGYAYAAFNPVYHDPSDSAVGYDENVALRFVTMQMFYHIKPRKLDYRVNLLKIENYPPINAFLSEPSWEFNLGFESMHERENYRRGSVYLKYAKGLNVSLSGFAQWHTLAKAQAELTNKDRKYHLGTGVKSGIKITGANLSKTIINFNYDIGYTGHKRELVYINFYQGFYLTRNFSLRFEGMWDLNEGSKIQGGVSISF